MMMVMVVVVVVVVVAGQPAPHYPQHLLGQDMNGHDRAHPARTG